MRVCTCVGCVGECACVLPGPSSVHSRGRAASPGPGPGPACSLGGSLDSSSSVLHSGCGRLVAGEVTAHGSAGVAALSPPGEGCPAQVLFAGTESPLIGGWSVFCLGPDSRVLASSTEDLAAPHGLRAPVPVSAIVASRLGRCGPHQAGLCRPRPLLTRELHPLASPHRTLEASCAAERKPEPAQGLRPLRTGPQPAPPPAPPLPPATLASAPSPTCPALSCLRPLLRLSAGSAPQVPGRLAPPRRPSTAHGARPAHLSTATCPSTAFRSPQPALLTPSVASTCHLVTFVA